MWMLSSLVFHFTRHRPGQINYRPEEFGMTIGLKQVPVLL
jgi:hypothetical protein